MGESCRTRELEGMLARRTDLAGWGLFASRSFDVTFLGGYILQFALFFCNFCWIEPGDVLWEESPFLETREDLKLEELQVCASRSAIFRNQIIYMHSFASSNIELQTKLLERFLPDRHMSEQSFLWKSIAEASALAAEFLYMNHSEATLQKICLIFMANQYPSRGSKGAIYEVGSLFNHHCSPNATYTYDKSNGKGKWIALRPIAPEDEICVSYVYPHYPAFWRQDQLRHRYLFDCRCSKCEEPDLNRMIPCRICHPHNKSSDLSKIKSIQDGFFIPSPESGVLDSWVCDLCGSERATTGVPILLEKQLCVDVQMMMSKWMVHDMDEVLQLRDLTLRLLGPRHFCYIYSLQCTCNIMIRSKTNSFKELVSNAHTVVDWVEEREPGFSGFHLRVLLLNVIHWCFQNRVELATCTQFINLIQPWVYIFGSKKDRNEIRILKRDVDRAQGATTY